MPAKSERQRNFARMSLSEQGRARLRASGKKPMARQAAEDFARALRSTFKAKGGR